jgi:hypothetical protein
MRRKSHKPTHKKRAKKVSGCSRSKSGKQKRSTPRKLVRPYSAPKTAWQTVVHQKTLAVLSRMRRGMSLARAAKLEHIKQSTFLRYAGTTVYRSGPGKPWKATKSDRLSAKMTILTPQGPTFDVVRGSVERTRLARYDIALRKFRAGEDGSVEELMGFAGLTVAGHELITDPDLLIRLEEAGQLDFDALYYSAGARL